MLNIPLARRYNVRIALDRLDQHPGSSATLNRRDDTVLPTMLDIPLARRCNVRHALDRLSRHPVSLTPLGRLGDTVLPNHAKHPAR